MTDTPVKIERLHILLAPQMRADLDAYCAKQDVTVSDAVREALTWLLGREFDRPSRDYARRKSS